MTTRASKVERALLVLVLVTVLGLGWTGIRLWLAWAEVEREAFSPGQARIDLESPTNTNLGSPTTIAYLEPEIDPFEPAPVAGGEPAAVPDEYAAAGAAALDDAMDVYLIIGSDQRASLGSSRRADVIMVFIVPTGGSHPVLVSIPRDLYLRNPCTGEMTRVNANLNGCGSYATGPEQVAVAVEDYTGVPIDHFIVFTFDGFRRIVDRVGGVEICTDTAVRDFNVDPVPLNLPAGCTIAGGDQALAWVRSRRTQGLVDGAWVSVAGSDLVRNRRQQDLILQALQRLGEMSDVSELTALVEELAPEFTIDAGLSLPDAIAAAWSLRSIDLTTIARPALPVADFIDPAGRWVLVPQATFESILLAANPELAPYFGAAA